jgi:NADH-quinone oxidoreductase subunit J
MTLESLFQAVFSEAGVFYVCAAVLLVAAVMVITLRNPVHAALSLVLCFFACAAVWILLEAEFLGIALVLVYVGAVMVLFLFVVMMLDVNIAEIREGFVRALPVGVVIAGLMAVMLIAVVGAKRFGFEQFGPAVPAPADFSNTAALGKTLFTKYLFPFEIASVILLVAIVVAIMLTLRKRPDTKYQHPSRQVQVRREDRIKLVSMRAEGGTATKEGGA